MLGGEGEKEERKRMETRGVRRREEGREEIGSGGRK